MSIEAAHWEKMDDGRVLCRLCPTGCRLREGRTAPCGTRAVEGGRLVATQYGRVVSAGVDPIEKKPLYHFHPGEPIFSVAAHGCNLHCRFCQNASLSQEDSAAARIVPPEDLVEAAVARESMGIAYTYSEPLVWFEYVRDVARRARVRGLKNVIVSNGYLCEEPLRELLPLIDAANFDLKSMDPAFYRKVCKGKLEPVLRAITLARDSGVHVEVTNLVIPGLNDSDEQLTALVDFVAGLGVDVPLHFSAYHPAWKCDAPATPATTLARAAAIGRAKLDHVFVGNLHLPGATDTLCPQCRTTVIARGGYATDVRLSPEGGCPECGRKLPIVLA